MWWTMHVLLNKPWMLFAPTWYLLNGCDTHFFYFQVSDYFSDNTKPPKTVGENAYGKAFND